MYIVALALSSLLAIEVLDIEMNVEDKKQTGVSKLSEKEKAHLLSWIDQYYVKRDEPLAMKHTVPERSLLQENLQNGHYIRLADKSLWNIRPQDVPVVQGWITPVDIVVSQSGDAQYPYKLTNSVSGSSVFARKVENVPESTPAPVQPTPAPAHPTTPPSKK